MPSSAARRDGSVTSPCWTVRFRRAVELGVPPGQRDGLGREVDRDDRRARDLGGDRDRDAARAAAQVDHERSLVVARTVDRDLCHDLRLGSRHEHARLDEQRQVPEARGADQVLQRLAVAASVDQARRTRGRSPPARVARGRARGGRGRGRGPRGRSRRAVGTAHRPRRGSSSHPRRGPGRSAGASRVRRRPPSGVAVRPHASPAAARRAASSASIADCTTGASSPPSTASRL